MEPGWFSAAAGAAPVPAALAISVAMPSAAKKQPGPFGLAADVVEKLKEDTATSGEALLANWETSAAKLTAFLASGHAEARNESSGRRARGDNIPRRAHGVELAALDVQLKERSLRQFVAGGHVQRAVTYCGCDARMQLQLLRLLMASARFADAAGALKGFLHAFHERLQWKVVLQLQVLRFLLGCLILHCLLYQLLQLHPTPPWLRVAVV